MLVEGNDAMFRLAAARYYNYNFGGNLGGIHAIATGMHYSPTELSEIMWINLTNKESLEKKWTQCIENLNLRKFDWATAARRSDNTFDFLKNNIYD